MTRLDPLALWGVQGMSPGEARALLDAVRHSDTYPSKTMANWELYNRAAAVIAQTEAVASATPPVQTPAQPEAPAPFCGIDIPDFLRRHGMHEETSS